MLKQTLVVAFALLGWNGAGMAQEAAAPPASAQAPPASAQAPTSDAVAKALAERTCPLPQIADTVPMEPISGSDLMTVPISVNGATQQFLLDIGLKKPTSVSPQLVTKLSLPQDFFLTDNISGDPAFRGAFGNQGLMNVRICDVESGLGCNVPDRYRVGSFAVGRAAVQHRAFNEAAKGEISPTAPYAGYMTGDFFRQYDVELDFGRKQVTWLTPSQCTDPHQVVFWAHDAVAVIPVTLAKDGRYQMKAAVNGHLFNAEIDTSSANTVMRRDVAEHDVGLKADTPKMVPLGDRRDGMGMQIYVSNFPQIIFGGSEGAIEADNVPVLIQDYSMIPAMDRHMDMLTRAPIAERIPDLAIGMDVLKHLHMYFVPGQGKVYVTAADSAP